MDPTEVAQQDLHFSSAALEGDPLLLRGVAGRERLGQLYEYRLFLRHDGGPLSDQKLDDLLLAPCCFTIGGGDQDFIHGIVREIRLAEAVHSKPAHYVAKVVPTVWLLTLSKISRVFQGLSVVEMAKDLLTKYGLQSGRDFEFRTTGGGGGNAGGPGHAREFCVQYDESDWAFIQRWLEHEGLYYWFEHLQEGEKLVVGDAPPQPIAAPSTMSYHEWSGQRPPDTVSSWRLVQKRIPARVVLKDYNYRNPSLPLVCQEVVDSKRGFGTVFNYGEHFRDEPAGKALAARRAAQLRAARRKFAGVTECTRFRVGHSFKLEDHFESGFNQSYLITAMRLRVGITGKEEESKGVSVAFEAIPAEVQFRPEQTVPWPSIHGVMHAHIDSDASGEYSGVDEFGRYRVRFPFDASGALGEKASQWVRMAQPYAGAGYGSHFPLHKGTEVLLAFLDGDPDRPIILGAVPNAVTPSPSARKNATQSVISTASGIRIEMEDKK